MERNYEMYEMWATGCEELETVITERDENEYIPFE